jgi:hypothetical protein
MKQLLSGIILASGLLWLYSCEKFVNQQEPQNKTAANFLQGQCPYECHDTRCKAYSGGYCGTITIPPDQLPQAQFIAQVGTIHNSALTYGYNNANLTWTNGSSYANACMNSIAAFYASQEGNMTIPYKTDIVNFAAGIFNNYSYYGDPRGKGLDSIITNLINQIAPTRAVTEKNLLLSALNIYKFDNTAMTDDQMYQTILTRAMAVQQQYNTVSWPSGTGGCIGGYLQVVINSANYWKYVSDYGVPPGGGSGLPSATIAVQSVTKPNFSILKFFRALSVPQLDAGGYLWGWGKSYFGGEPSESQRIKAGVTTAAEASFGGWVK